MTFSHIFTDCPHPTDKINYLLVNKINPHEVCSEVTKNTGSAIQLFFPPYRANVDGKANSDLYRKCGQRYTRGWNNLYSKARHSPNWPFLGFAWLERLFRGSSASSTSFLTHITCRHPSRRVHHRPCLRHHPRLQLRRLHRERRANRRDHR